MALMRISLLKCVTLERGFGFVAGSECAERSRYSEALSYAVAVAANNCHEEVLRIIWSSKSPVAYNRSPVEKNIFRCRGDAVSET